MSVIATVDISRWRAGGAAADAVAAEVDEGLQQAGFILVTGHGVDPGLARAVRAASREFFAQPVRRQAAVLACRWAGTAGSGRAPRPTATPRVPRRRRISRRASAWAPRPRRAIPDVDRIWFAPNVWPAEVPGMQALVDGVHRRDAPARRRSAGPVRARAGAADQSVRRAGESADLDDEHQPLPARQRRRGAGARPVPHRAPHRFRHGHRSRP